MLTVLGTGLGLFYLISPQLSGIGMNTNFIFHSFYNNDKCLLGTFCAPSLILVAGQWAENQNPCPGELVA